MPSSPLASPRKAPKQQRSRATVDAILTATTQVLTELGYEKATTNLIARRAGVSIGSLYQYFPNKEALVMALADRHLEDVTRQLMSQLDAARGQPLRDGLKIIIESLLQEHLKDTEVHRVFKELGPRILGADRCREVDRVVEQAIASHLAQRPEALRPRNLRLGVFMLMHGVEGVTHAALTDRPETIQSGELARELVDLIERYLLTDADIAAN